MGQKRHFKGNNASEDKKRRKEAADKWKSTRGDDGNKRSACQWVLDNKRFEAFYKAQHFVNGDEDWASFMEHLRTPLPACFRICPDYAFADELCKQLLGYVGKSLEFDGLKIQPVQQLHWYPNGYGYKLGTDRRSIRKLDGLGDLHKWLMQHTDNGNITRQEAVSMVPPLALGVLPHHKCLDMCAAPGSKTSQLLEVVNRSLKGPESQQGLVVANDADTDRAYMLVHQCKRINSPLLIVTTHKGQSFPPIDGGLEASNHKEDVMEDATSVDAVDPVAAATKMLANAQTHPTAFFDRVLCDVPCSGDGTLRKNPAIWTKWCTAMGVTLHPLQLMIAQRGLQLLKSDSLMVYSTCSMSPYENESVVAELLRNAKGGLELVDARQFLPLFKTRPGLSQWVVLDDYFAIKRESKERRARMQQQNQERKEKQQKLNAEAKAAAAGDGDAVVVDATVSEESVVVAVVDEDAVKPMEKPETDMEVITTDNTTIPVTTTATTTTDEATQQPAKKLSTEDEDEAEQAQSRNFSHIEDAALRHCLEMGMRLYPDADSVPSHLDKRIRRSLFPPTAEEREWMHLERCMRCVPQDEDTGGFFVATLRKVTVPKPIKTKTTTTDAVSTTEAVEANKSEMTTTTTTTEAESAAASASAAEEEAEMEAAAAAVEANEEETNNDDGGNNNNKVSRGGGGSDQRGQGGLVAFHQWDETAYNKIKEFYGFATTDDNATTDNSESSSNSVAVGSNLIRDAFFVREDFATSAYNKRNRNFNNNSAASSNNNSSTITSTGFNIATAKAVYFVPYSARQLMKGDKESRLKIVTAGVKVLEKKVLSNGEIDYRLMQEGIQYLAPSIRKRKLQVPIQDFCNILGGGLVSYSTLAPATLTALNALPGGIVISYYDYDPADTVVVEEEEGMIPTSNEEVVASSSSSSSSKPQSQQQQQHTFYAICWKGNARAINVMCGKVEIESMKHQLAALKVLRTKVVAPRYINTTAATAIATTAAIEAATTSSEEISTTISNVDNVSQQDISEAAVC